MIQRFIIDGEPKYCELIAKVDLVIDNDVRIWHLVNHEVEIKFREHPFGQFDKFIDVPNNIDFDEDTREELKTQIDDTIDEYIKELRSGIESTEEENNLLPKLYPYDPKQIKINNFNWSVDYTFELLDKEIIKLSPDFQRNFVWNYKSKCRLIESILLGIPVPSFYLAKTSKGYHVVDGLQRLTTINQFMNNEFPLKYLEYLNESQAPENNMEGRYFKSEGRKKGIGDNYEFTLKGTQFNVNVIDEATPTQVKFDVFRRINTGGKPLNNQEIRNSIMEDIPRKLVNELAESEEFKMATGSSVSTKRMNAQELVMRFVGFWFTRVLKSEIGLKDNKNYAYQGDMQMFLDDLVEVLNTYTEKYSNHIRRDFIQAMENAEYLFGDYSFRKCLPEHLEYGAKKQLINKSLFTTWSVMLSQIKTEDIYRLVENRGDFAVILSKTLEDTEKIFAPDNDNKIAPKTYFEAVSYNTNHKASLNMAFHKTKQLINTHLSHEKSHKKTHHPQF